MSNKIKEQLGDMPEPTPDKNVIELSNWEFSYLGSLTTLQNSMSHYFDNLKSEYIKILTVEKWGYNPEDTLQFSIDMASESHQLTIIELPPEDVTKGEK